MGEFMGELVHFRVYTSGPDKGKVIGILPSCPNGPGTVYAYTADGEAACYWRKTIQQSRPALPREYQPLLDQMNCEFADCMAVNFNAAARLEYRTRIAIVAPWVENKFAANLYFPDPKDDEPSTRT